MLKLIDRNRQIPGGLKFYLPHTKWSPRPWASLHEIAQSLYSHLQGNPQVLAQLNWPLDIRFLEDRIDEFNANICQQMGWGDYIQTAQGGAVPSNPFPLNPPPPPRSQFRKQIDAAVAGPKSMVEWLESGAQAVPNEQAAARALVCLDCPSHEKGDWTRFFTTAASEAIRTELNKRNDWKLSTPSDPDLEICGVCLCPMRLKVHMPIEIIRKRLTDQIKSELHEKCWIRNEP